MTQSENKCFPATKIDKCLCMSFLSPKKLKSHLQKQSEHFSTFFISLSSFRYFGQPKKKKRENMVAGSKKCQNSQYKPFLNRKAYVFNSNAQKFLERVLDFSP